MYIRCDSVANNWQALGMFWHTTFKQGIFLQIQNLDWYNDDVICCPSYKQILPVSCLLGIIIRKKHDNCSKKMGLLEDILRPVFSPCCAYNI
jgi:hypothetical protein